MKRILVTFLLLASVMAQSIVLVAGQVNITLIAVADNYADSKYPRSAYGHVSALYVGNSYDHAQDIWGSERIYVSFNLTEIPKGRIILGATLWLWQYYAPAAEQNYEAHRVLGDWNETTENWINQPSSVPEKTSEAVAPARAEVAVQWDITSDVKAWYSEEAHNYGTMIKIAKEEHARDASSGFWSRDYSVEKWKPRLIVTLRGDPAFTYTVKVGVEGMPQGMTSTISVDAQPYTQISSGNTMELAFDLGTTHTVAVSQLISNTTGVRYRCNDNVLQVSVETSRLFVYTAEYVITFSTDPADLFQTPKSGWYQSGMVLSANRTGADLIEAASGVRLVFDGWHADSRWIEETSLTSGNLRPAKIVVDGTFAVEARYRTEYYLNVSSPYGRPQGSGWYTKDSTASLSVDSNLVPAEGFLGVLGLRHSFTRWIGSDDLIGAPADTRVSVLVSGPGKIEAVWQDDWSRLFANVGALLTLVVTVIIVGRRRMHR